MPRRWHLVTLITLLAAPFSALGCGPDDKSPGRAAAAGSSGTAATGGTPADGSDGEGGSTSDSPRFPCEVEAVIQAKCQRCHDQPPKNGAPFPLLTWEDTRGPYGTKLVYQAMLPAIETDFMPLTQLKLDPPVEPLTPEEKTLLLDWLAAGAPAEFGVACD